MRVASESNGGKMLRVEKMKVEELRLSEKKVEFLRSASPAN